MKCYEKNNHSPLLTSHEMARLDCLTMQYKAISQSELMLDAATALFNAVQRLRLSEKKVLIICGGGNNGGDGYALATLLAGYNITVYILDVATKISSSDTLYYREQASNSLLITEITAAHLPNIIDECSLIVDAVFGTGFHGALPEHVAEIFSYTNSSSAVKLAVDIPSGVCCNTAKVAPGTFKADITVTFEFLKPGLVSYPSKAYCGSVEVVDIGFPSSIRQDANYTAVQLNPTPIDHYKKGCSADSNKGNYGKILSVCGSKGMSGAAYLSATGALRSGAGLLHIACEEQCLLALQIKLNEPVFLPYSHSISELGDLSIYDCILHGCGCGKQRPDITEYLLKNYNGLMILDADALNNIAANPAILQKRSCTAILTPHPGEMSRLTGYSVAQVQSNRICCALELANKTGCIVVLKGAATIIAEPDGRYAVNPTGNPGMAKGGSGDILAGMIAAYCTKSIDVFAAVSAAVYEHGAAADRCLQNHSMQSLLPSDILNEINRQL